MTVVPNTERRVKDALLRDELPHHIFRHNELVVRHGQKVERAILTFPRYVFVPAEEAWQIARGIDRVIAPVCFAGEVATLPPGHVERLVASCVDGDDLLPIARKASVSVVFMPGDWLEVVEGAMVGEHGKYVRPSSPGRCLVELEFPLLKRKLIFDLAESSLRLVADYGQMKTKTKRKRYKSRGDESQLAAPAA